MSGLARAEFIVFVFLIVLLVDDESRGGSLSLARILVAAF